MDIHYDDRIEVHHARHVGRDVLIGVAAGVAGTWVMEKFWSVLAQVMPSDDGDEGQERDESRAAGREVERGDRRERGLGEAAAGTGPVPLEPGFDFEAEEEEEDESPLDDVALVGPFHREEESAPETAGRVLHRELHGYEPDDETRARWASGLHWAQGMAMGGLYGLFRGARPGRLDLAGGAVFGVAVWLTADEVAVPALGLAKGPTAQPLETHLQGLAAHVVYGIATAATAQALDRMS